MAGLLVLRLLPGIGFFAYGTASSTLAMAIGPALGLQMAVRGYSSLALVILSGLLLANARSEAVVFVAAAIYGAGSGSAIPIRNAMLVRICPPDRRGAANATFFAAMDIGVGLGSLCCLSRLPRTGRPLENED